VRFCPDQDRNRARHGAKRAVSGPIPPGTGLERATPLRVSPLRPSSALPWVCAALASCGSHHPGAPAATAGALELVAVRAGRLADVWGLERGNPVLYERDVLVGPEVGDEREPGSAVPDAAVLYDFVPGDRETLQPRLFITREIGSEAFRAAFAALGASLALVAPASHGQDPAGGPFSVVARDAALELALSGRSRTSPPRSSRARSSSCGSQAPRAAATRPTPSRSSPAGSP
jgi:hypothetical protein